MDDKMRFKEKMATTFLLLLVEGLLSGLGVWLVQFIHPPWLLFYLQGIDGYFWVLQFCYVLFRGEPSRVLKYCAPTLDRTIFYLALQCTFLGLQAYFWQPFPLWASLSLSVVACPLLQNGLAEYLTWFSQEVIAILRTVSLHLLAFAINVLLMAVCRECLDVYPTQSFYQVLRMSARNPEKLSLLLKFSKNFVYAGSLAYMDHRGNRSETLSWSFRVASFVFRRLCNEQQKRSWTDSVLSAAGFATPSSSWLDDKEVLQNLVLQEDWEQFLQVSMLQKLLLVLFYSGKQKLYLCWVVTINDWFQAMDQVITRLFAVTTIANLFPWVRYRIAVTILCLHIFMLRELRGWVEHFLSAGLAVVGLMCAYYWSSATQTWIWIVVNQLSMSTMLNIYRRFTTVSETVQFMNQALHHHSPLPFRWFLFPYVATIAILYCTPLALSSGQLWMINMSHLAVAYGHFRSESEWTFAVILWFFLSVPLSGGHPLHLLFLLCLSFLILQISRLYFSAWKNRLSRTMTQNEPQAPETRVRLASLDKEIVSIDAEEYCLLSNQCLAPTVIQKTLEIKPTLKNYF